MSSMRLCRSIHTISRRAATAAPRLRQWSAPRPAQLPATSHLSLLQTRPFSAEAETKGKLLNSSKKTCNEASYY